MYDGNTRTLDRFTRFSTTDPDELRARVGGLFSVRQLDFPTGAANFGATLEHCQMGNVGLTFARYGAPMTAMIEHSDNYLQGFPLKGGGSAVIDRASGMLERSRGVVGGPGARLDLRYSFDFEHFIVRISPEGLLRKLACLIDAPVDPPLKLESGVAPNDAQLRLVEFVMSELSRADGPISPIMLVEMEQLIMVGYLAHSRHNYSQVLNGGVQQAAPWQVRRAEEYIRENWDKALSIEELAAVANTSVRNLFHTFRTTRGISPMAFARRVRLTRARALLSAPQAGTTVTSVAFDCGFSNLGAFARYYQASYGELPSETLRAAMAGFAGSPARH